MSNNIDPTVRLVRAYRRDSLRSLERMISFLRRHAAARAFVAQVFADHLHDIKRNPRPLGSTKDRLFTNAMKQLETSNDRSTATPS